MKQNLTKQYNGIANTFNVSNNNFNRFSNTEFFSHLPEDLSGKKLLDVGCGDGNDFEEYQNKGADVYGTDASEELINLSKFKEKIILGSFDSIPFEKEHFDVVVSKYALQTSAEIDPFYNESARILKQNGELLFLVVHPMRQFFEKKTHHKDYFDKTVVDSSIFNGTITVKEPTHTMQEYLSETFFNEFTLESIYEGCDFYSAEKIGSNDYPTYLIIKAHKK